VFEAVSMPYLIAEVLQRHVIVSLGRLVVFKEL
jgi:hypothetical protein